MMATTLTFFVIPVFGIPASGKSELVKHFVSSFVKQQQKQEQEQDNNNIIISTRIIELDDIYSKSDSNNNNNDNISAAAASSSQKSNSTSSSSSSNNNFDIDVWIQARNKFYLAVTEEILSVCSKVLLKISNEEKENDTNNNKNNNINYHSIIFAVDNMPLKSMRWRVRSAAINGLLNVFSSSSSQQNQENQEHEKQETLKTKLLFAPIGIKCNIETALSRNSLSRTGIEKIPDSVITLMEKRMEFSGGDVSTTFVIENNNNSNGNNKEEIFEKFTELISEKILKPNSNLVLFDTEEYYENLLREQQLRTSCSSLSEEEIQKLHKASRTASHQFDLLRRQANGNFMTNLRNAGAYSELMKKASKILEKTFTVDVDRKLLSEWLNSVKHHHQDQDQDQQHDVKSSSSVTSSSMTLSDLTSEDLEQASQMLGAVRDSVLAKLLDSI